MPLNFEFFHKELLKKSKKFKKIEVLIEKNGVLKIKKPKLDIFTFTTKTIISQQISDLAARTLWKKFCNIFNNDYPKIEDIKNQKRLNDALKELGISKQKIKYIKFLFSNIKKLSYIDRLEETQIRNELLKFPGIGNWTCDMILIFYLLKTNIFPMNDLIIKKTTEKLKEIESKKINFEENYSPYLSIFSLHLWKMSKRIL